MFRFPSQEKGPKEALSRAIEFLEKGKIKRGEKLMKQLLKRFPNFLPARLAYADFLLRMEASYEALHILREGLEIEPEDLNLRYMLAVARQKCWQLNLAEKEFEVLRKRRPEDPEIMREIGWTKVLKGEIKEGRKLLRKAINLDLTNPLPYLDLGASYAMCLNFKEAVNWMETAKHLGSREPIILEKIEETKRMEREFEKFSKKDKRKMREMRKDPEELRLVAIQNMLLAIQEAFLEKEDMEDVKKEMELAGVNPKMIAFRPPETKEEETIYEYMEYHHKVDDVERKVSKKEFSEIRRRVLNPKTKKEELRKLLLILAHQGTKEAVNLLEEYSKSAPKELEDWTNLALEECKILAKAKPGQVVKIIHH